MIIVTGGAGFIGSNIVHQLNQRGETKILVVDDLTDGIKFKNLVGAHIIDYMDKNEFLEKVKNGFEFSPKVTAIFHEGACSNTMEWNGQFIMENNYTYSKILLDYALARKIPFIYASSAAVYGDSTIFKEAYEHENPLNPYGYSKWLFDHHVRQIMPHTESQIVGLRYFNVYGPREQHKGNMASVAYHHYQQLLSGDIVKLFEGTDGYGNGEQQRDFVFIEDIVNVNLWFLNQPHLSGIFNLGTGQAQTFNDVAHAVIYWFKRGHVQYIPFPDSLKGRYQSFTQADISLLRKVGYLQAFHTVEQGVKKYLDAIHVSKEKQKTAVPA